MNRISIVFPNPNTRNQTSPSYLWWRWEQFVWPIYRTNCGEPITFLCLGNQAPDFVIQYNVQWLNRLRHTHHSILWPAFVRETAAKLVWANFIRTTITIIWTTDSIVFHLWATFVWTTFLWTIVLWAAVFSRHVRTDNLLWAISYPCLLCPCLWSTFWLRIA